MDRFQLLGWIALVTLTIAIARQLSNQPQLYLFPDSWGKQYANHGWQPRAIENFSSGGDRSNGNGEVDGSLDSAGQLTPADSDLNPRSPYSLLKGVLGTKDTEGELTAKTCYQKDYLSQTNKVGNYIQRTNNFKHATPDDCSAPLTEMVDSFYTNPSITLR